MFFDRIQIGNIIISRYSQNLFFSFLLAGALFFLSSSAGERFFRFLALIFNIYNITSI